MNHFRGQRNGFCHSLIEGPISFAASWTEPPSPNVSTRRVSGWGQERQPCPEIPFPDFGSAQGCVPPTLLGWLLAGVGFQVPNTLSACVLMRTFLVLWDQRLFCSQRILHTSPLNSCNSEKSKTSPQHVILEVSFPFFSIKTVWNHFLDEIVIWYSTFEVRMP